MRDEGVGWGLCCATHPQEARMDGAHARRPALQRPADRVIGITVFFV